MAEKRVLTTIECAKELGLCQRTIYKMLKEGKLPYIKAGDKYLIPVVALDRYLANAGSKA